MRDPLPPEVVRAFTAAIGPNFHGGHGGSHAFLVHEFVESVQMGRQPAIDAWTAAAWMAAGVAAHKSAQRDGEWVDVVDFGPIPAGAV